MSWVSQYVVAAAVFCVLDLIWLGTIAEDTYARLLAVLRDFPAALVPIDLAWGTFLAAAVSVTTYAVVQRLPAWARGS